MIINLKQLEIEQALRAYVQAQGISLQGKDISISFTAGRKDAGLSAEICIDDIEIPGFSSVEEDSTKSTQAATVVTLQPAIAVAAPVVEADPEPEVAAEPEVVNVKEDATETKATASLFG
jgi:hypothetical protein